MDTAPNSFSWSASSTACRNKTMAVPGAGTANLTFPFNKF